MTFTILDTPRNSLFLIILLLVIITVLSILFIDNHSRNVELEMELSRINKELYLKQITYEKRMKEFEKEAKKHQEQIKKFKSQL